MVKNKLESLFSESFHADTRIWGMKLISNPLTHQNTPADYILDYHIRDGTFTVALVECKMATCEEDGKARLAFKRLRQMHDILNFENVKLNYHKGYFCIAYWDGRWSNSEVYMIPVQVFHKYVLNSTKVSMNREDAKTNFGQYQMKMKNGILDMSILYS
jgi:hypothetical protein